ncbi:hypothetical protein GQ600_11205 [Phytophthora cactorum]|nr:hypothetical protein GQ600_11205 [Phytophthora cactorum]
MFSMIAVVSAAKPIMLAFDDAQWMDNRSLSLCSTSFQCVLFDHCARHIQAHCECKINAACSGDESSKC